MDGSQREWSHMTLPSLWSLKTSTPVPANSKSLQANSETTQHAKTSLPCPVQCEIEISFRRFPTRSRLKRDRRTRQMTCPGATVFQNLLAILASVSDTAVLKLRFAFVPPCYHPTQPIAMFCLLQNDPTSSRSSLGRRLTMNPNITSPLTCPQPLSLCVVGGRWRLARKAAERWDPVGKRLRRPHIFGGVAPDHAPASIARPP
ncbi:hypothetical protein EJ06DRAFT_65883 [Trichodelitschia bisporula]|uniref:Uncharacterized protein n=1 Tax=Trichodelitschia bisporula TaxID=703511 RepID=A0A6G1HSX8_9PEZI|nr:hypothetical protein EJ06DRAFT_65883 [Trichodelitschia bisporula]